MQGTAQSIREIFKKLQEDENLRAELAKVVATIFDIFQEDWFRWEVMGWVLALYLGWSADDIGRHPELGWVAKAMCAAALMQSDDRKERLLGRALLYHTELPPRELFVAHGGELIPAIVYHYQLSARTPHIMQETIKVFNEVKKRLKEEGGEGGA